MGRLCCVELPKRPARTCGYGFNKIFIYFICLFVRSPETLRSSLTAWAFSTGANTPMLRRCREIKISLSSLAPPGYSEQMERSRRMIIKTPSQYLCNKRARLIQASGGAFGSTHSMCCPASTAPGSRPTYGLKKPRRGSYLTLSDGWMECWELVFAGTIYRKSSIPPQAGM